ncbi:MAG: hypothetical protein QGM50_07630 [Anaerolineae bacterium]|nr:hypothetical protein [Anaerolineae bacterium]MDK1118648.1 hypothetical protein [Anaerolineae bacterium]
MIGQFNLFVIKFNRQNVRLMLTILTMVIIVLGIGAPMVGGG